MNPRKNLKNNKGTKNGFFSLRKDPKVSEQTEKSQSDFRYQYGKSWI